MPSKSFALKKSDPVVEQFQAGVRAWERPSEGRDGGAASAVTREARTGRARGNIGGRKGIGAGTTGEPPVEALPEDDPTTRQFKEGAARWEHPFEHGNDDD